MKFQSKRKLGNYKIMKNKEKKFDESYIKGFADGIKTNQAM